MIKKYKCWAIPIGLIFLILISFTVYSFQSIASFVKYEFSQKAMLKLSLSLVNPAVNTIAAEPSNRLLMRVEVRDSDGTAVPMSHVKISVDKNLGKANPSDLRTDNNGEHIVTFIPPDNNGKDYKNDGSAVKISAVIHNTGIKSTLSVKLIRPPVIFVHGYQEYPAIFENMKEYLTKRGFESSAIQYASKNGVIASAKNLYSFLYKQKIHYLSKGYQVNKFDMITHSMGGLVARYYTCSEDYIKSNNVRKIIFISVPQKGSPWAPIGAGYFNDQGIKDLMPDSSLYNDLFPAMLNKGLNRTIQIGSILGQYDEVVSLESASLDEWNVKTEIFAIGDNNFTMNNILNGNIIEAHNHRNILSNKKVFARIEALLNNDLPYPVVRRK